MNVDALLLVYCVGAAALALWVDVRFPGLAPADLPRAIFRLIAIAAVGWLAVPLIGAAVEAGTSPVAIVLGLVLPVLMLFFLAALWLMRTLQGMLFGLRR